MGLYIELFDALNNAKNERIIDVFLKNHINLIRSLNEHSWNLVKIRPQFKIGTKYVADYIVLSACSGYWNCVLIEIQRPNDPIFTKKKESSAGLREAERQVGEWRAWIGENESAFRSQLAELVEDEVSQCIYSKHKSACSEIRDLKTWVRYTYKVLIGRRAFLNEETNKIRGQNYSFEIVTFDRLLDYAKRIDDSEEYIKSLQIGVH